MTPTTPALALEHVAKHFGTVEAVSDGSLAVLPGTVHALLGENGAGKTTLMRIAFGMLRPDAGNIRVAGTEVSFRTPADAIARGLGMVHQHFTGVPAMSVAENVALGGRGRYDVARARARVLEIGRETGLTLDPKARAAVLPVEGQQRLEIIKAIAHSARVLILDEPTAVLAPPQVADLLATLRRLADSGTAVVMITHKLREALEAADDVTVLRRGRTVRTTSVSETSEDALVHDMLGTWEQPTAGRARRATTAGRPVIVAQGISVADEAGQILLRDITFEARAGEILGVAGIEGAGHHELLHVLAGRATPIAGSLQLPPRIALIPADRQRDALVLEFPLYENVALKDAGLARGRIRWSAMATRTSELMSEFDVRAPSSRTVAAELSGGNQQRLVLARELGDTPEAVVAENPTRGLDVAAAAAVHDRLLTARAAGVAVIIHASDLDEVLELADRVVVVAGGRLREVVAERATVGRAMLGLES